MGSPPSSGSTDVGARHGRRGGGAAGSPLLRMSNRSTSRLFPASRAQTFWAIRVRSVWSVTSSDWVSRGSKAVQRGCGRRQSGQTCSCAMHSLQNQCSCLADFQWGCTAVHQASFRKAEASKNPCNKSQCHRPPTAVSLVRGCFERLRGGQASAAMCAWEAQGTPSTYCLHVAKDAIC